MISENSCVYCQQLPFVISPSTHALSKCHWPTQGGSLRHPWGRMVSPHCPAVSPHHPASHRWTPVRGFAHFAPSLYTVTHQHPYFCCLPHCKHPVMQRNFQSELQEFLRNGLCKKGDPRLVQLQNRNHIEIKCRAQHQSLGHRALLQLLHDAAQAPLAQVSVGLGFPAGNAEQP